jgi:hypothetical protein
MVMKIIIIWNVKICKVAERYQHFRKNCYLISSAEEEETGFSKALVLSTRMQGVTSQLTALFWILEDRLINQQHQR